MDTTSTNEENIEATSNDNGHGNVTDQVNLNYEANLENLNNITEITKEEHVTNEIYITKEERSDVIGNSDNHESIDQNNVHVSNEQNEMHMVTNETTEMHIINQGNQQYIEQPISNEMYSQYIPEQGAIMVDDLSKPDNNFQDHAKQASYHENAYVVAVVDGSNEIYTLENQQNSYSIAANEIIEVCNANNTIDEVPIGSGRIVYNERGEDYENEIVDVVHVEADRLPVNDQMPLSKTYEKLVDESLPANEQPLGRNYQKLIEDEWDVDDPAPIGDRDNEKTGPVEVRNEQEVQNEEPGPEKNNIDAPPIIKSVLDKKNPLKYSSIIVSKKDIVEILDSSADRLDRPIVKGKDLFFSIELTKRLNQKIGATTPAKKDNEEPKEPANNNAKDDHMKIMEILEADEIKDWKPAPNKNQPKDDGNDLEITQAIQNLEKKPEKKPKRTKNIDKELERTIALKQLREQFPNRRRQRTSKKINHIPFLASTPIEKALTEAEVTVPMKTKSPRRRPCYLPEEPEPDQPEIKEVKSESAVVKVRKKKAKENTNVVASDVADASNELKLGISKEDELDLDSANSSVSSTIVRTYSAKRKSTDAENDVHTALEAFTEAAKVLNKTEEEPKPKKQKTVVKDKKIKKVPKTDKKRNSELEKLLGDEGAIRMIYDTQKGDVAPKKKVKTATGLKKDLMIKTKLVKNAVMRLSGVGSEGVSLRGKRRSGKSDAEVPAVAPDAETEALFASTPNVVVFNPKKKKQRADASRILYRHSSSESFDSSDESANNLLNSENPSNVEKPAVNGNVEAVEITNEVVEPISDFTKSKRTKMVVKKRLKKSKHEVKDSIKVPKERISIDSKNSSKIQLKSIPVRKSSRPRMVSKKYSIWASTSMDSLSVESLGLKKLKKPSHEFAKKLNCKELIILQPYGNLAHVVLAPVSTKLKNALNVEVLKELISVFNFLSDQDNCKVVLLTSTGSTFCQGIDLSTIASKDESERKDYVTELVRCYKEFIQCLSNFTKPIVAGVHAAAVGLGVTLLPYCDVAICSDRASFYTPYMRLGQVTEGVATFTFPRINKTLVSQLLFRSLKLTALEGMKYGLVSQILQEDTFEEELMLIARSIASQSLQSMRSIKSLLVQNGRSEIDAILNSECETLLEHWTSPECINNMIKFMNSGELQLKQLDAT